MIQGIEEINLPSHVTLNSATITMQNMGDQTIEATLSIDRNVTPDFSEDWVVKYNGAEFIHPLRTPQASKSSDKPNPEYPLTFYHKGIYDLKRKFFFTYAPIESGTAVPDKYEASLALNIVDFVNAYRQVLEYHFGDYITIDLNPNPTKAYDSETTAIAITYTKMWDLLTAMYENYKVSWSIEPGETAGKYVIKVGYDRPLLSHQFAYGFEGGLLKMERQVQSPDIINILLGRGGDKNLPYRYFKDKAEDSGGGGDEATFRADPDWIPELASIPFDGLRDVNFRYWVQGWKDKRYAGGVRRYAENEHWAYDMGFAATSFDPVEYVKDPASIAKYGELWGGLQQVEDIYPSIQGVFLSGQGRADQAVAVSEPQDEPSQQEKPSVIVEAIKLKADQKLSVPPGESRELTLESTWTFNVNDGYKADILTPEISVTATRSDGNKINLAGAVITTVPATGAVVTSEGDIVPVDIPSGKGYKYKLTVTVYNGSPYWADISATCSAGAQVTQSVIDEVTYNTFELWVKNIWETAIEAGESERQYAERVWRPILGDHLGSEAAVVFSSGLLSISEDYEFLLAKIPEYDTSKTISCEDADGNAITAPSHWKLTLRRSDAEYDATGKYLPNASIHANAGEYFFFIGIDMPHKYVVWAEERLNAYKRQQLDDTSEVNPTWAVELSKIRAGHPQAGEAEALISLLRPGADVDLYSKWFVSDPANIDSGETYRTTIQTLTLKYEAPKNGSPGLLPSVSVTLSDKPASTSSSLSLLQGSVDALTSRINSMSAPYVIDVIKSMDESTAPTDYNVYSAMKAKKALLSSQESDTAEGHITFDKGLTAAGQSVFKETALFGGAFVEGLTGLGGAVYPSGHAELESLTLRSWLEAPELRFNRASVLLGDQWNAPGGGIVESVTPDRAADGSLLPTGTMTLKLEKGEMGAVAVDDICKGYYHDFITLANNAAADSDDSRGNTEFAGFCTVYFRVTEILSAADNSEFRYALRPVSDRWGSQLHPYEQMHFVAYGSFTDEQRQKSAYQTRSYTRYLKGVDDWEFDVSNIAMQFGDLSNLQAFGLNMAGYSAYLQNIYMTGTIEHVDVEAPAELSVSTNTGDFFIADGESLTLFCSVKKAWEDLTDYAQSWAIARDTGDAAADAAWNASHVMLLPRFTLSQSDIGATALNTSALFTITAAGDGWTASKTVACRTLRLPTTLSMRFVSEYGAYDTFITYGDIVQFQAVIEDGLRNDYTADYDQWKIERHNGDTADDIASDGVWNVTRAAISSTGVFSIEWSAQHDDLQAERATFIVTAQKGSAMSTQITGTLSI